MSSLRPTDPNAAPETRGWADLDAKTQASLLALMPKSVRARVRRGEMPSEKEVEDLMRKHYDLDCVIILWQVSDKDSSQREECRRTVKDAFVAARQSLERQLGAKVRTWTDLQVMCMAVPPPPGHHWEITTLRQSAAASR